MIAVVCVDDSMGMMFNGRRQSRDRVLAARVAELARGNRLWMNPYSYELFENIAEGNINIDLDFLSKASDGELCFVENEELQAVENIIEKLILFRWNRSYPSDMTLDIDLRNWRLEESQDFVGSSHDKITMEVYIK